MAVAEAQADPPAVKVVEQLRVSPPQSSVPPTTLPLTFFDAFWLSSGPVQRLFFYDSDGITTDDFLGSQLPALRCSLSLALQTFFSLAGNIAPSPETGELVIAYAEGDSVAVLVAESDADFAALVADHAKDVKVLHPLVPPLPADDENGRRPLLAVQVTIFPGAGLCLGVSLHHSAADGNGFIRFMKHWAAIHRSGGNPSAVQEAPVYDRGALEELEEEKKGFLQDLERFMAEHGASVLELATRMIPLGRIVRSTIVLTRSHIDKLQDMISDGTCGRPSSFVAALSYVWVCTTKARGHESKTVYFSFAADCRTRLDPPVPDAYFGNCIGGVHSEARGAELVRGADGLVVAARAIQAAIGGLNGRVVEGMREMVSNIPKLIEGRVSSIAGSPRFRVYDTNFGWGPPKKVEIISIESSGAMSLAETRDGKGGMEIGMVGPEAEMERFAFFFSGGLQDM